MRPTSLRTTTFHEWSTEGALVELDEEEVALLATAASDGDLYLATLRSTSGPPAWQTFLSAAFGLDGFQSGLSDVLGAVIFCAVADPESENIRWLGWAFGSGSRSLDPLKLEPRFGLICALNRIVGDAQDADAVKPGLRRLEYDSFGGVRQHTGHRAAAEVSIDAFRIDTESDLPSAVGGKPASGETTQVFGKRSLQFRSEVADPTTLITLAHEGLRDFRSEAYRDDYGFVDYYLPVDEPEIVERLKIELAGAVASRSSTVDAFLPDDLVSLEVDQSIEYVLLPREPVSTRSRTTLTVEILETKMRPFAVDDLDKSLRFVAHDGTLVGECSVLECLTADLTTDDGRFLLSEGVFFKVDGEYIDRLNGAIAELTDSQIQLPCYSGENEGPWNEAAAAADPEHLTCTDAEFIRLTGIAAFEAADLVSDTGQLVHVKRKGRASALSYVFAQARRSCRMLVSYPYALTQFWDILGEAAANQEVLDRTKEALGDLGSMGGETDIEVVLAILGDWRGRTAVNLPLLAKIELKSCVQDLTQMGFTPTLALVDSCAAAVEEDNE